MHAPIMNTTKHRSQSNFWWSSTPQEKYKQHIHQKLSEYKFSHRSKMTCLFCKKWMPLGNRMCALQVERKTPLNLNSKISDGINNRTLHSGGLCPTLSQSQHLPLGIPILICRISKGSLVLSSDWPLYHQYRQSCSAPNCRLTQPSLD